MANLVESGVLELLQRVAKGIVAVVGPHCEAVIHDLADPEHSVVCIEGRVTGRSAGAPIPDLSFVSDELNRDTPDQLNYRTRIGSRSLQSSTIWVRDESGVPVGALCINVDYSDLNQAMESLNRLSAPLRHSADMEIGDTFAGDLDALIRVPIREFLAQNKMSDIETLKNKDKLRLIQSLEERGLFRLRGAVNRVAQMLNVTRATVYNHRANVKENKNAKKTGRGAPQSGPRFEEQL